MYLPLDVLSSLPENDLVDLGKKNFKHLKRFSILAPSITFHLKRGHDHLFGQTLKPFPQECFNTSFVTMKYWFLKKIRMWEKKGGGNSNDDEKR